MIIPTLTGKLLKYHNTPLFITKEKIMQFTTNGILLSTKNVPKNSEFYIKNDKIFSIETDKIYEYSNLNSSNILNTYEISTYKNITEIIATYDKLYIIYQDNARKILHDLISNQTIDTFELDSKHCICNSIIYYTKDKFIYKRDLNADNEELVVNAADAVQITASELYLVYSTKGNKVFIYNIQSKFTTLYHSHSNRVNFLYIDEQNRMVYSVCKEKILQFNIKEEELKFILNLDDDFVSLIEDTNALVIHRKNSIEFYDKSSHSVKKEITIINENCKFVGHYTKIPKIENTKNDDIIPKRNKKVINKIRPVVETKLTDDIYVLFNRPGEIIIHNFFSGDLMQKYRINKKIIKVFLYKDLLIFFEYKQNNKVERIPVFTIYRLENDSIKYLTSVEIKINIKIPKINNAIFYNNKFYIEVENKIIVLNENGGIESIFHNMSQMCVYNESVTFLNGKKSIVCEMGSVYLKHPINAYDLYANIIIFINENGLFEYISGRVNKLLKGKFKSMKILADNVYLLSKNVLTVYSLNDSKVLIESAVGKHVKTFVTSKLFIDNSRMLVEKCEKPDKSIN